VRLVWVGRGGGLGCACTVVDLSEQLGGLLLLGELLREAEGVEEVERHLPCMDMRTAMYGREQDEERAKSGERRTGCGITPSALRDGKKPGCEQRGHT
jgi:hypothetical protein